MHNNNPISDSFINRVLFHSLLSNKTAMNIKSLIALVQRKLNMDNEH